MNVSRSDRYHQMLLKVHSWALRAITSATTRILEIADTCKYRCAIALTFEPRDTDIFIVTYPKAGTTLMQMLLYQLVQGGDMESIAHIEQVAPWFERAVTADPVDTQRRPSPRVFKTHRRIDDIPKKGRIIYVIRDPRDTCVSYFHHLTSQSFFRSSPSGFIRRFMRGKVPWGSWFSHTRSCLRSVGESRVLLLTYDEITNYRARSIDKIVAFCGLSVTPEDRERAIAHSEFSYMKQYETKFDPRLVSARTNPTGFIRVGKAGAWQDELTPAASREIAMQGVHALGIAGRDPRLCTVVSPARLSGAASWNVVHGRGDKWLVENAGEPVVSGFRIVVARCGGLFGWALGRRGRFSDHVEKHLERFAGGELGIQRGDVVKLHLRVGTELVLTIDEAEVVKCGLLEQPRMGAVCGALVRFRAVDVQTLAELSRRCSAQVVMPAPWGAEADWRDQGQRAS